MRFTLDTYLATRRASIETALDACLPVPAPRPDRLAEAMRHAVLTGGKRLRPILCLASAEAVGGRAEQALLPACAVELLHAYTLTHDDLPCMDTDLLRRGQPTVHAHYGETLGVLVGDALQALAFETLARTPESQLGLVARLTGELAAAAGAAGVIAGQVEDLRSGITPTKERLDYIFRHKTADLFRAACRLGAIAAHAAAPDLARLSVFADELGFAFQITDDLLDEPAVDSRAPQACSCLSLLSRAEAQTWASACTHRALDALHGLSGDTVPLAAIARHLLMRLE